MQTIVDEKCLKRLKYFIQVFHRTASFLKNVDQLFEKPSYTCGDYMDMNLDEE